MRTATHRPLLVLTAVMGAGIALALVAAIKVQASLVVTLVGLYAAVALSQMLYLAIALAVAPHDGAGRSAGHRTGRLLRRG